MNEFEKAQSAKILACYGIDVTKSEENDFEKGGEGSRGGKIIGHTKSGKPIYLGKRGSSSSHKDFTKEDHLDAVELKKKHYESAKDKLSHSAEIISHGDEVAKMNKKKRLEESNKVEKSGDDADIKVD